MGIEAPGLARALLTLIIGRGASVSRRTRVLQIVSVAGLVVAVVNLAFALPRVLAAGGAGPFIADLAGTVYTLTLIAVVAGQTRTVPWRAVLGLFFVGFFGVTALATLVGRPVLVALGPGSVFGPAVYAPVTEELLKALPVAAVLWLSARHRSLRPSVGDAVLLGVAVSAGFALAVGLLYGRRFRWAWAVIPLTFAVAAVEHMTVNGLTLTAAYAPPWWVRAGSMMTLDGHLSWLLLVVGLAVTTFAEARAVKPLVVVERGWGRLSAVLPIDPVEAARRARALALVQSFGTVTSATPDAASASPALVRME